MTDSNEQSSAKLNVISSLLSFSGRWFTNSELAEEAGITKQLANYHMRRFVDNGTIQHDAKRRCYKIIEVDNLVRELAGIRVKNTPASLDESLLFEPKNVTYYQGLIEFVLLADVFGIEGTDLFRKRVAEEFDEASRVFKKMASKVRNTRLNDPQRGYRRIKNLEPFVEAAKEEGQNVDLWTDAGEFLAKQFKVYGVGCKEEAVAQEWKTKVEEVAAEND